MTGASQITRRVLQVRAHPADDVRLADRTRLTRHFATGLEEHQGRNAANAKFTSDFLRGVGIELGQPYLGLQLCSGLGVLRRHGLAGTTPRSPEVYEHWNVVPLDMTAEIAAGEFNWM